MNGSIFFNNSLISGENSNTYVTFGLIGQNFLNGKLKYEVYTNVMPNSLNPLTRSGEDFKW